MRFRKPRTCRRSLRLRAAFAILFGALLGAPQASAERLVREVSFVVDPSTSSLAFQLPRFPSSLGNLRAAEISMETHLTGTLRYENTDPFAHVLRLTGSRRASVALPGGPDALDVAPRAVVLTEAPAYDGTTDFGGTSGRTITELDVVARDVVSFDQSMLSAFTGGGSENLTLQISDEHLVAGGGTTMFDVDARLAVDIEITYLWTPADALVRTLDVNNVQLPWVGFEFLDAFPPSTGELEKIEIQVDAVLNGNIGFESMADFPGRIDIFHGGFLDLRLGTVENQQILASSIRSTSQYFVDAFDLLPDDAGTSGAVDSLVDRRLPLGGVTISDPFMLLEFVESGGQIGVIFEALDAQFASGPGGAGLNPSNSAAFEVTVVYQFDGARQRFCIGDGGETPGCTPCPCFNNDFGSGARGGCMTSLGVGAELFAAGGSSITTGGLRMAMLDMPPGSFAVLASANNRLPGNGICPPGSGLQGTVIDGLRCVGGLFQRHGSRMADAEGTIGKTTPGWGPPNGPAGGLAGQGGFTAGSTRQFQAFLRDNPANSPCGNGQNSSNGLSITFLP